MFTNEAVVVYFLYFTYGPVGFSRIFRFFCRFMRGSNFILASHVYSRIRSHDFLSCRQSCENGSFHGNRENHGISCTVDVVRMKSVQSYKKKVKKKSLVLRTNIVPNVF